MKRTPARSGAALLIACAAAASACGGGAPELAIEPDAAAPAAGVAAPRAIVFDPPLGAADVDPARTSLSVTFDRPMHHDGWAWVIENPATAPGIGASSWDATLRTNTVEVTLEPGRSYVVWVNSAQYPYFKDAAGTPATPVRWSFSTRGAAAASAAGVSPIAAHAKADDAAGPRVLRLEPADGAAGVDPSTSTLRVTFDRPMEASWAWVTDGPDSFPPTTAESYFEPDGRTVVLPVRLEPGRTYAVWLNSPQHQLFRDLAGRPLEPRRWSFTTAGASAGPRR